MDGGHPVQSGELLAPAATEPVARGLPGSQKSTRPSARGSRVLTPISNVDIDFEFGCGVFHILLLSRGVFVYGIFYYAFRHAYLFYTPAFFVWLPRESKGIGQGGAFL